MHSVPYQHPLHPRPAGVYRRHHAAPRPQQWRVMPAHSRSPATGAQVASLARQLVGSANRRYYGNPGLACASFVSAVLIRAGQLPAHLASPSASVLVYRLKAVGFRQVAAGSVGAVAPRVEAGDVIAFSYGRETRIAHVGIAIGPNRFIGTSSSRGRVLLYPVATWRSQRSARTYRLYRHQHR